MKILFAVAMTLGIAAVAYGAAATLQVNGGDIQHGEDVDLTCDDEIGVTWATDGAIPPSVDFVTITGVADACNGEQIRLQVTGGPNPGDSNILYDANPVLIPGELQHAIPAGQRPLVSEV